MSQTIARTLASTVQRISASFPVLLLTGPRQVGKTTLLEQCAEAGRQVVTLDDLDQRDLARHDPALFLQRYRPPLIIDEVQYAPELFNAIKIAVDRTKAFGQFWLTDSQKFHLMQGITESLAGRVAILDLLGLAQTEMGGHAEASQPFLPTQEWIDGADKRLRRPRGLMDIYRTIWRCGFPRIALDADMPRDIFFSSYLQTYIQRDVQSLAPLDIAGVSGGRCNVGGDS